MLEGAGACCKKGFTALFLSRHHPDTPPTEPSAELSFVSEVNQTCAQATFAESVKQQMIKHAYLHTTVLNLPSLHGDRSRRSLCQGLIIPLIKFTLPVSSTPICDG